MKAEFWEYYPPESDWFDDLWAKCFFVMDSSVLLDLYKYSDPTLTDFMSVLDRVGAEGRLWLPHHVGEEYHAGRAKVVVREAKEPYDSAQKIVDEISHCAKEFESQARHAYLDKDALAEQSCNFAAGLTRSIANSQREHPDSLTQDPIRERLAALYEGRVGPDDIDAYSPEFEKIAKVRYSRRMPPGFEDIGKDLNRYGDLIIWQQMQNQAKIANAPVIFVTNDSKADWWSRAGSKTLGPHVALRKEFREETGQDFYAYSADVFLERAQSIFGDHVSDASIEEVRERHERDIRDDSIDLPGTLAYSQLSGEDRDAALRAFEKARRKVDSSPFLRALENIRFDIDSSVLRNALAHGRVDIDSPALRHALENIRVDIDSSASRRALESYLARQQERSRPASVDPYDEDTPDADTDDGDANSRPESSD